MDPHQQLVQEPSSQDHSYPKVRQPGLRIRQQEMVQQQPSQDQPDPEVPHLILQTGQQQIVLRQLQHLPIIQSQLQLGQQPMTQQDQASQQVGQQVQGQTVQPEVPEPQHTMDQMSGPQIGQNQHPMAYTVVAVYPPPTDYVQARQPSKSEPRSAFRLWVKDNFHVFAEKLPTLDTETIEGKMKYFWRSKLPETVKEDYKMKMQGHDVQPGRVPADAVKNGHRIKITPFTLWCQQRHKELCKTRPITLYEVIVSPESVKLWNRMSDQEKLPFNQEFHETVPMERRQQLCATLPNSLPPRLFDSIDEEEEEEDGAPEPSEENVENRQTPPPSAQGTSIFRHPQRPLSPSQTSMSQSQPQLGQQPMSQQHVGRPGLEVGEGPQPVGQKGHHQGQTDQHEMPEPQPQHLMDQMSGPQPCQNQLPMAYTVVPVGQALLSLRQKQQHSLPLLPNYVLAQQPSKDQPRSTYRQWARDNFHQFAKQYPTLDTKNVEYRMKRFWKEMLPEKVKQKNKMKLSGHNVQPRRVRVPATTPNRNALKAVNNGHRIELTPFTFWCRQRYQELCKTRPTITLYEVIVSPESVQLWDKMSDQEKQPFIEEFHETVPMQNRNQLCATLPDAMPPRLFDSMDEGGEEDGAPEPSEEIVENRQTPSSSAQGTSFFRHPQRPLSPSRLSTSQSQQQMDQQPVITQHLGQPGLGVSEAPQQVGQQGQHQGQTVHPDVPERQHIMDQMSGPQLGHPLPLLTDNLQAQQPSKDLPRSAYRLWVEDNFHHFAKQHPTLDTKQVETKMKNFWRKKLPESKTRKYDNKLRRPNVQPRIVPVLPTTLNCNALEAANNGDHIELTPFTLWCRQRYLELFKTRPITLYEVIVSPESVKLWNRMSDQEQLPFIQEFHRTVPMQNRNQLCATLPNSMPPRLFNSIDEEGGEDGAPEPSEENGENRQTPSPSVQGTSIFRHLQRPLSPSRPSTSQSQPQMDHQPMITQHLGQPGLEVSEAPQQVGQQGQHQGQTVQPEVPKPQHLMDQMSGSQLGQRPMTYTVVPAKAALPSSRHKQQHPLPLLTDYVHAQQPFKLLSNSACHLWMKENFHDFAKKHPKLNTKKVEGKMRYYWNSKLPESVMREYKKRARRHDKPRSVVPPTNPNCNALKAVKNGHRIKITPFTLWCRQRHLELLRTRSTISLYEVTVAPESVELWNKLSEQEKQPFNQEFHETVPIQNKNQLCATLPNTIPPRQFDSFGEEKEEDGAPEPCEEDVENRPTLSPSAQGTSIFQVPQKPLSPSRTYDSGKYVTQGSMRSYGSIEFWR